MRKMRDLIQIVEGQFRSNDVEEFVPDNESLNNIKSKYLPEWEMLDHRTLEAQYVAQDHRQALEFVKYINSVSEDMDHFAEVIQDVSEVTIKTTTTDVDGLTVLDFELALRISDYARKNNIELLRAGGNF
jgi:pterin-4a-carbinolamine dehydratase